MFAPTMDRKAMESAQAAALLSALAAGEPKARQRALEGAFPIIQAAVVGWMRTHRSFLKGTTLTEDDVVQEVVLRLLRRPPTNPGQRRPDIVLRAWSKLVARNLILDRHREREDLASGGSDGEEDAPAPAQAGEIDAPRQRARLHLARAQAQLLRCAEDLSKRDRAAFALLRDDPDRDALELAAAIGMTVGTSDGATVAVAELLERRARTEIPDAALEADLKKAQQNAWALRSRLAKRLRDCMARHGYDGLLREEMLG
jgi:DNA-directed RNA polymerase specialized sigma24 family protein